MDIPIDSQAQEIIDSMVGSGRYASASDVIHFGLQLLEERETKLNALRATLEETIADDVWLTDEQVGEHLQRRAKLRTQAQERVRRG